MKTTPLIVMLVLSASCQAPSALDVESFINHGFGFEYSDELLRNPRALEQRFGKPLRLETREFETRGYGGFDQLVLLFYDSIVVEYLSYKNPKGKSPAFVFRYLYSQPGSSFDGIFIGMSESEVRNRFPGLGAKRYRLVSSELNQVTFTFAEGKLKTILWSLVDE